MTIGVIIHNAKITILAQVCKLCLNRKRNTLNKGHKNKKMPPTRFVNEPCRRQLSFRQTLYGEIGNLSFTRQELQ